MQFVHYNCYILIVSMRVLMWTKGQLNQIPCFAGYIVGTSFSRVRIFVHKVARGGHVLLYNQLYCGRILKKNPEWKVEENWLLTLQKFPDLYNTFCSKWQMYLISYLLEVSNHKAFGSRKFRSQPAGEFSNFEWMDSYKIVNFLIIWRFQSWSSFFAWTTIPRLRRNQIKICICATELKNRPLRCQYFLLSHIAGWAIILMQPCNELIVAHVHSYFKNAQQILHKERGSKCFQL